MRSHAESEARRLSAFAPNDFRSSLACAIGFRDWAYRRHAGNVQVEERYFGFVYVAVGEKRAATARS